MLDAMTVKKGQVWTGKSGHGPRITILGVSEDWLGVFYEEQANHRRSEISLTLLLRAFTLSGEITRDGTGKAIQPDDTQALNHLAEARETA